MGLSFFLALILILAGLFAACPQTSFAKAHKIQTQTIKKGSSSKTSRKKKSSGTASKEKDTRALKVAGEKRKGKLIDWHSYLPEKYRAAYHVMQGAATDGKYNYLLFWKKNKTKCIMLKVKASNNKLAGLSTPLQLYHGNDLAYNPSDGLLYTVYSDQKPFLVTVVDPVTLTIRNRLTVQIPADLQGVPKARKKALTGLVGITYNAKRNQYAMRVAGKNDFLILDAAFCPLQYVPVTKTPALRRQSMDCDDKYIYIGMDKAGSYNLIAVYDWEGKYKASIRIPLPFELEGIFHIGKKFYATFYNSTGPSSHTYRIYLPKL